MSEMAKIKTGALKPEQRGRSGMGLIANEAQR